MSQPQGGKCLWNVPVPSLCPWPGQRQQQLLHLLIKMQQGAGAEVAPWNRSSKGRFRDSLIFKRKIEVHKHQRRKIKQDKREFSILSPAQPCSARSEASRGCLGSNSGQGDQRRKYPANPQLQGAPFPCSHPAPAPEAGKILISELLCPAEVQRSWHTHQIHEWRRLGKILIFNIFPAAPSPLAPTKSQDMPC